MKSKPSFIEFNALLTYLQRCEQAAAPPPAPPRVPRLRGLLDWGSEHDEDDAPAPAYEGYPATLGDVMSDDPLTRRPGPYQAEGRLPADRPGRVVQLQAWLREFPSYLWMRQQLPIAASETKFEGLQKRRADDPKFADDIAIFRFWTVATYAALFMDSAGKAEPTAAERKQAVAAATALRRVAAQSTLLRTAGLDYFEETAVLKALESIKAMSSVARRARNDEFTDDRKFIELLVDTCLKQFSDAPPVLICELAALKVQSPDLEAIKKQVTAIKRARGFGTGMAAEG